MESEDLDSNSVPINYLRNLGKVIVRWREWSALYILQLIPKFCVSFF